MSRYEDIAKKILEHVYGIVEPADVPSDPEPKPDLPDDEHGLEEDPDDDRLFFDFKPNWDRRLH